MHIIYQIHMANLGRSNPIFATNLSCCIKYFVGPLLTNHVHIVCPPNSMWNVAYKGCYCEHMYHSLHWFFCWFCCIRLLFFVSPRIKKIELKKVKTPPTSNGYGEDSYQHHSDSEGAWSDVEGIYNSKRKRRGISRKEARRRRAWASDKDPTKAAGRSWPALPKTLVSQILGTMLDQVIKLDKAKGGLFSEPGKKCVSIMQV